ncbi:hypothetical protein [Sphingopyxis yananensis]|uniref:hypothetical protein n=1 Tax=Sphingopyxis yananensis TaxID=2886687 RepID=UPI001D11C927|nr:hypothetical protein [Sphingopyxis yananensis]MCC2602002.1 hypothetical protein [Sphingopyxis yananensis]
MSELFAGCDLSSHLATLKNGLYHWQTLASGCLALLAAGIGAYYLRKQTRASFVIHMDSVRRQHNAIKVSMIPVLMQIFEKNSFAFQSICELSEAHEQCNEIKFSSIENEMIAFDLNIGENSLKIIKEFIETIDQDKELKTISGLLINIDRLNHFFRMSFAGIEAHSPEFKNSHAALSLIHSLKITDILRDIAEYCEGRVDTIYKSTNLSNSGRYWDILIKDCTDGFEIVSPSRTLEDATLTQLRNLRSRGCSQWEPITQ